VEALTRQQNDAINIKVGEVVSLKIHPKERQGSWINRNIYGIVWKVNRHKGLGIKVVTEHGILAKNMKDNDKRSDLYIPSDMYNKTKEGLPISALLSSYSTQVKSDTFCDTLIVRISCSEAFRKTYKLKTLSATRKKLQSATNDTIGDKVDLFSCKCKNNKCTGKCGCFKNNRVCSDQCPVCVRRYM